MYGLRLTREQIRFIDELFARHGGKLDESQLVNAARSAKSPFHEILWGFSDKEGSRLYRLNLARKILRTYVKAKWGRRLEAIPEEERERYLKKVGEIKAKPSEIPAAFQVRVAPEKPKQWVKGEIALTDEYMRQQIVAYRITLVRRAVQSLRVLEELVPLADELDAVISRFKIPDLLAEPMKQ